MKYTIKHNYYSSVIVSVEAENAEQARMLADTKMANMADTEMAEQLFDNRVLEGTETDV